MSQMSHSAGVQLGVLVPYPPLHLIDRAIRQHRARCRLDLWRTHQHELTAIGHAIGPALSQPELNVKGCFCSMRKVVASNDYSCCSKVSQTDLLQLPQLVKSGYSLHDVPRLFVPVVAGDKWTFMAR